MRKWTVRAARALLVGAAFAAVGGGIANADNNTTRGDRSLLGGVLADVTAPVTAPITANNLLRNTTVNANGNAVNALSPRSTLATGAAQRLSFVNHHHDHGIEATSIGSDDKVHAPLTAPILICGNAISDSGLGTAACRGHSSISSGGASSQANSACPATCSSSTQVTAEPAKPAAPACPTACDAAQPPAQTTVHQAPACAQACSQPVGAPVCPEACNQSSAQGSSSSATHLLSNDQVSAPVAAPIVICGNSGAIRGLAAAACDGDASFARGGNS
ncbi:chaplin family protein [Actinoallomurus sp. NPDC052274]|uniref:chaplin family protein n=1 Tax=Actinoallomurus sp. NPDC052274 TaxID=3155420 RepID=UPI003439C493